MIRVENLRKTYDKRVKDASPALHGLSFTLPDTGFVCIVGPSGCGKTTLLNAMGALDVFDGGAIRTGALDDVRCGSRLTEAERNRSFGYIFQNYYLLPQYSAAYNVYLGLHSLDLTHREKLERVLEALRAVDMERFARRAVGELSGGQQQRVAIARALARRPRVIFADEPTGNLDEANTMNICTLLRRISRSSLVVMVTHEMRIARFFADRILTLSEGRLAADEDSWPRTGLPAADGTVYTGELQTDTVDREGLTLSLLREAGAAPVNLTLLVQRDRVVIKLDDSRAVTCGGSAEPPHIVEGARPVLDLEQLDRQEVDVSWESADRPGRAGSGLSGSMLLREARNLFHGGVRRMGSLLFLILLTVLTLIAAADYIKVASIDPEDFVITDSHILELNIERGQALDATTVTIREQTAAYVAALRASGLDPDVLPHIPVAATYSTTAFLQMADISESFTGFSYVPLDRLDPDALILGRMPERPGEVVVDRWVLESLMRRDGILQRGITNVSYFLNSQLHYMRKNYSPTIVGISDCGEPAVFLDNAAFVSLGTSGNEVISLSAFKALFPGAYDGLELAADECLVLTNNAGSGYAGKVGHTYTTNARVDLTIVAAIRENCYASFVVADETVDTLLTGMLQNSRFYVYCGDKTAVKEYIASQMPPELDGLLQVTVTDANSDAWARYRSATQLRMDGRRIVTVTIIVLSLVMLYLLQRSRVQERVGMVAVYRLLGIPGRKLAAIFALEGLLLALVSILPVGVLTWAVVGILGLFPSLDLPLLLPWYGAAAVCLAILAFLLLSSLLPLCRLLRQPPARLAARYDL